MVFEAGRRKSARKAARILGVHGMWEAAQGKLVTQQNGPGISEVQARSLWQNGSVSDGVRRAGVRVDCGCVCANQPRGD